MSNKNSFIKGAAILGAAGIVIKMMGAFFKVPLANMLGDEGMSYYQTAYPVYIWLLTISSAGLPTAIAKMISERNAIDDYHGIRKVFKVSFYTLFSIGVFSSVALFFSAEMIVKLVENDQVAVYSIKALAPAIFFTALMSTFRGFFQGLQDMKPYAISQIVEQLFRVLIGLGLVFYFVNVEIYYASAGAAFGATVGGMAGLGFMFFYYLRNRHKIFEMKKNKNHSEKSVKELLKELFQIAVPITLGAAVIPVNTMIDTLIVMRRLNDIGFGDQANDLYGQLSGYIPTLINLPAVITAAIQLSIVPAIASFAVGSFIKVQKTTKNGIRLALIVGLPASVGLVFLSDGIIALLYPRQMEIAESLSNVLKIAGWGVLFLSVYQITTGILQGLGKPHLPAKHLLFGVIIKALLTYVLVGIPEINILGAAFSTIIAYAIGATLNYRKVVQLTELEISYKDIFFKPIGVTVAMGISVVLTNRVLMPFIGLRLATVLAVVVGIIVYFVLLIYTRTITEKDYKLVPGGDKLEKITNYIR